MNMKFDNHDTRIKYYELLLERDLEQIPSYDLPDGFRFVFYEKGDRDAWIAIEMSAREFTDYEQGLNAWRKYYADHEQELPKRMIFIENADGEKIATATAFYDVINGDASGDGWLLWVAVSRECQGKGLSKPLISYTMETLRNLGYTHMKVPTQTTTWLACKLYLDFGFYPQSQNAVESREGWRIIKALTNHSSLGEFDCAAMDEITID